MHPSELASNISPASLGRISWKQSHAEVLMPKRGTRGFPHLSDGNAQVEKKLSRTRATLYSQLNHSNGKTLWGIEILDVAVCTNTTATRKMRQTHIAIAMRIEVLWILCWRIASNCFGAEEVVLGRFSRKSASTDSFHQIHRRNVFDEMSKFYSKFLRANCT